MTKDHINGSPLQRKDPQCEGDGLNDLNGKIIGGAWLFAKRSAEKIELDARYAKTDASAGASYPPPNDPKAQE